MLSLAERDQRPTLREFVRIVELCAPCRAYIETIDDEFADVTQLLDENGPEMIAALEAYYPGAIYATLGRDAFPIADVLEAFYFSLGIEGRVVRLGASTATFQTIGQDQHGVAFLEGNMLDFNRARRGTLSYAIIDRTSYRQTSQSAQLARIIFTQAKNDAEKIRMAKNIGVVSSNSGYSQLGTPENVRSFKQGFEDLRNGWQYSQTVPNLLQGVNMSHLTDQNTYWHNGFGYQMERTVGDNFMAGNAAPGGNPTYRLQVLRHFWELYQVAGSEAFQNRVWAAAKEIRQPDIKPRILAEMKGKPYYLSRENAQRRLNMIVRRDLQAMFPAHEFGSEGKSVYEMLFAERRDRFADLVLRENDARVANYAHRYNSWRKQMNVYRQSLGLTSEIAKVLQESTFNMEPYDFRAKTVEDLHVTEDSKKAYFSPNAKTLQGYLTVWNKKNEFKATDIGDFLRVIEETIRSGLVTSRDDRRLILLALASLPEVTGESIEVLKTALNQSPLVKRLLADKAKVFLTTKKYDGKSRQVYAALVEAQALPYPNECADALLGGGGDEE